MRALAIDFGTKNIGVAVSDALGITVRPVETIRRSSIQAAVERIRFLVEDLEAERVIVGLPLRLDGSEGDTAGKVMRFVERLKKEISVPVVTHDERLTSYEAEQMMIERRIRRDGRRERSDELAAMIILRDYLAQGAKN
ncbi:MAG TPA: Holliday junction resolvase RuvX [Blastocatellia bacterium]|jgi:putative Holliday junction resolvase